MIIDEQTVSIIIKVGLFTFIPVLYWGFNFIVLYHLLRFGVGVQPKRFACIYFLGSTFLFFVLLISSINTTLPDINNLTMNNNFQGFIKQNTVFYFQQ
jgi:hypothetical protein